MSSEPNGPPGARRARLVTPAFLLVTGSTLAYFLSVGTLFPVLPRYVSGPLSGGSVAVGLAVGSFSFSAVLLRPFAGRLADRVGRRPLMIWGAAIVTVSVAAYRLAHGIGVLISLRLVNGAGEALFFTAAAAAITDLAPAERRGEAVSLFSVALYGGIAVGPLIGETVLGTGHFTLVWIVGAALSLFAAVLAVGVPDTRADTDAPPAGREISWTRRVLHPAALAPGTILATSVWGFAGFSAFVPLYALRLGLSGSDYVFLTYASIILAVRLFGARLPDRLGAERTAGSSLAVSTTGLVVLAAWRSVPGLFVGAAVFAMGQALAFPALMTLAVQGTSAQERGAVVGSFTAFVDLAFGLGPVSLGAVASIVGYRGAFVTAGMVSALGLVLLGVNRRRRGMRASGRERQSPELAPSDATG